MDRRGGDGRRRDVLRADRTVADARTEPDTYRDHDSVFDAPAEHEGADTDPTLDRPGARGRILVGDSGHLTRRTRRGADGKEQRLPTRPRGRHATGSDTIDPRG